MRRTVRLSALCAFAAVIAGCSTTPSHFYMLSVTAAPSAPSSQLSIVVGPVSIPASVDQPAIVVSTGPNQVSMDDFNRWASPLQSEISHVVAANLVALLGTPHVSQFQHALNAAADYRVAIEVQNFASVMGEAATLDAVWIVRRTKDGKAQSGRTTLSEPAPERTYEALVAAHSRALARMSQDIANAVRALEAAPG